MSWLYNGKIFEDKDIELTGEARSYLTAYITETIFDYVIKKGLFQSKYLITNQIKENDEKSSGLLRESNENPEGT